jgi:hypothetical protein
MFIKGIVCSYKVTQQTAAPDFAGMRVFTETRRWALLTDDPASLNQADYQYYQTNDQQDVNQPGGSVGGGNSQSPQQQQNYTNCPKHLFVPSRYMTARVRPIRIPLDSLNEPALGAYLCGPLANSGTENHTWRKVQDLH